MLRVLLAVACLVGYQGCSADTDIDATTTYINNEVEILNVNAYDDVMIFHAPTCGYYDNAYDVKVEVYNPHNPANDPNFGRTYFAVTNNPSNGTIAPADIICSVDRDTAPYVTECTHLTSKGDIYVHVTGNHKSKINFAIRVSFSKHNPMLHNNRPRPGPFYIPPLGAITIHEMRPVITYDAAFELPYGNATLIRLRICPSSVTGNNYEVTSIIQADDSDSKSLIGQVICTKPKCTFDTLPTEGQVGINDHELPVNVLPTNKGRYTELYIYAVAYNGVLTNGYPIGKFRFGATIDKK